ncbi:MAG: transglutaminase domain-containing protein [Candidatus Thiodiazotropha endolucinida]
MQRIVIIMMMITIATTITKVVMMTTIEVLKKQSLSMNKQTQGKFEMGSSVIGAMRHLSPFMKSVAMAVVITFGMLVLAPAAMAARTYDWGFIADPSLSVETKLSMAVQQVEELLATIEKRQADNQSIDAEREALSRLKEEISQLDQAVTANFAAIDQDIRDKELPAVIQQRQDEMVANYRQQLDVLLNLLQSIETAGDEKTLKEQLKRTQGHLKDKKHKRSHQPFDPNDLPNRQLQPNKENKPKTTKKLFRQSGLFDTPYQQVAALGDFTYDQLAGADDPAYLAESDEIRLTQAIHDQAELLEYDPVKIFHWVRNNIHWLPSWGAVQAADLTLSSRQGNAFDIASLTIALLRASQIPARYVHGTIDVPEAKFRNWAGDFSSITAAAEYASSGGIPVTTMISGGVIETIRMEHIWVEAAIDYHPSRGAVNRAADSWIAMDPSYKQYEYLQGLDVIQISGIDAEQLAQDFVDSGTVNEDEGWVTGFDPTILQTAQTQAQTQLETYIQDNLTDPTVGDVIGGRSTIVKEYPILPSSLPNQIVTEGARYGSIPTSLQQQITYALNKDILGDMIDPITFPWSRLNNNKVTLSFRPATEADEQALQILLPEGEVTDISQLPTSIPSYLINIVPELKIEGQVVKTGAAMSLGEELDFVTRIKFAHKTMPSRTYKVIAGSYLSVNVIAGSVSAQRLSDLQTTLEATKQILESNDQAQIAALSREELLGDMFYAGTLGYYAQLQALSYMAGLGSKGHYQLGAGIGTIGYEPKVSYFFGVPRAIQPGGISFDIPLIVNTASGDGDVEKKKQFTTQVGVINSTLEHTTPELMFAPDDPDAEQSDGISAVKALQIASAQGQRIYQITQSNMSTALPNIHHDQDTIDEIQASLNAGNVVITHTDSISVSGWDGVGYIILDSETGIGAYKISGGANGGWWSDPLGDTAKLLLLLSGDYGFSDLFKFITSKLIGGAFGGVMDFFDILEEDSCGVGDAAGGAVLNIIVGSFLGKLGGILLASIVNPLVLLIAIFVIVQVISFITALIKSGVMKICRTR